MPLATSSSSLRTASTTGTSNIVASDSQDTDDAAGPKTFPRIVPGNRHTIGVALEGGGALGLAHIGVLQWFEEHRIPVDRLAGTSMGSLVGGLYASGRTLTELQQIANSNLLGSIFTLGTPYTDASFRRREDEVDLPQGIHVGLKGGPSFRNALIEDAGLNAFLRTHFSRYNTEALNYDRLPIPFRCVATDLNTMETAVFQQGPLPIAIRASISIPGVFSPVEYRGHYLVDGGIMDNLPTDVVKEDLHADVVIGVYLDAANFSEKDVSSIVSVFARAYSAGTARNERSAKALSDVLIPVELHGYSTSDYDKTSALISLGYAAAEKQKANLEPYALTEAEWQEYLADRRSRISPEPSTLQLARVTGGDASAQATVRRDLTRLMGKPIATPELNGVLGNVQGNGAYRANFETYSPDSESTSDGTATPGPDTGVLVRLGPVRQGPPFLIAGADVTAMNANVTRTTFDLRLINQNIGGFGSEFRTDLRVGFLTQLSTEYYKLMTPSGYFVRPQIGILRQPVYLWRDQKRISEHLSQQAGGELEIGRTVSRNFQTSLKWQAQEVRWHLVNGYDGTPVTSGLSQTASAHLLYDNSASGILSPQGGRIEATVGALFNTVGSEDSPFLKLSMVKSLPVTGGILGLSTHVDSYFKHPVAEPLRFALGGPLRLSASSIDEYRGTDTALVSAGYLYRLTSLPTGIGEGLYLSMGYEAGEIWSPERPAQLRQNGALTTIIATPLGVIKFGGAIGDAGRRKVFFSFGRLFGN